MADNTSVTSPTVIIGGIKSLPYYNGIEVTGYNEEKNTIVLSVPNKEYCGKFDSYADRIRPYWKKHMHCNLVYQIPKAG